MDAHLAPETQRYAGGRRGFDADWVLMGVPVKIFPMLNSDRYAKDTHSCRW